MKKYIYISFALLIFLFTSAEKSVACSCIVTSEPLKKQVQNAFKDSDAIFSGEVTEITESPTDKYHLIVKFKVTKSWKGEPNQEMTISTAKDSAMCGYNFEMGKTYLVYASGKNDDLSVTNCSRTAILSKENDGKYLDKLKPKKTKRS